MRPLLKIAKNIYFFFFNRLAHHRLARNLPLTKASSSRTINIVCRYAVSNGITNGALYHAEAFEKIGFDVRRIDISSALRNPFKKIDCPKDGLFVFHCAAPAFLQLAWPLRDHLGPQKKIGYFAWEFAEPPTDWPLYTDLWDEIWTTSHFSAASLSKIYTCPIRVVPHVLQKQGTPRLWKKNSEPLRFLSMADARSGLSRKNPMGTVAAFQKAFPTEQDVALTIKLQGSSSQPEISRFCASVLHDHRITIILETLPRAAVEELIASSHVYVSLHRGEGFGLPLLEARLSGLATIATGWSGNTDFMNENDSALIPYKIETTTDPSGIYGAVTWADPDIDAAAAAMRHFYDDPAYLAALARAGFEASAPEKQLAHLRDLTQDL